jgi:secondary thiamine-phosphate synthase enzyme
MMINTVQIELQTSGHCDVTDVTLALQQALGTTGPQKGQALVFVAGSTAGVTTVEFEPGLVKDLNEFFQNIIPEGPEYHHHQTWGDDNGSSHLRAALLKPSLTIPFKNGQLLLSEFVKRVKNTETQRHRGTKARSWIRAFVPLCLCVSVFLPYSFVTPERYSPR